MNTKNVCGARAAAILVWCMVTMMAGTLAAQESGTGAEPSGEENALPRVLVIPFANATGQPQNDAVATATTDTIRLTVNLLGSYELVEMPDLSPEQAELPQTELAAQLAEDLATESVLFGRVTRDEGGTFRFALSVYDRQDQSVTATTETSSDSLFGVFDAADELVADAVSAFAGVRVGFGAIRFVPDGTFEYRVYLDGARVGDDVRTVDRVLIGERTVRVMQLVAGRERQIHRESFSIEEGQTRTVNISVPAATTAEVERAGALVERIRDHLDSGVGLGGIPGDLEELAALTTIAPGALFNADEVIAHLRRRFEIVGLIPQMTATDFAVPALESDTAARDAVLRFSAPIADVVQEVNGMQNPDADARELRADAYRSGVALYNLLVLHRAAAERDEADMIRRLNIMLSMNHNRLITRGGMVAPYEQETIDSRRFYRRYDRAVRRRRPFWHWVAGTIGAAGFAGGAYLQLIGIPDQQDTVATELDRYNAATTVADAQDARSATEAANTQLIVYETARSVGLASGILVPIALYSRVRSLTRPGRIWRDYEDSPFRVSVQAAALDVRERAWEQGEPALLVVGEGQRVTIGDDSESLETPVYVPFDARTRIRVVHDTGMLGERTAYEVPREDGLSVVVVGPVSQEGQAP